MDYRPRARRYCSWRPYRLLPALRLDALSCSGRCRMAAHRAAHELRDAYREESGGLPGRDGYPDGEAAPVLASPGSHRRQAEGALLSLADRAIEAEQAQGRVRGNLSSFPRTRGQARKRLKRAKAKQRRSALPPSGAQGTQPPPGLQRVPRNAERRPPHLPKRGAGGVAPAGGTGGSPCTQKHWELYRIVPVAGLCGPAPTTEGSVVSWGHEPSQSTACLTCGHEEG